ncbi:urea amidolyase family protein [Nocardia harenae]|uniref:5-oxoprolinase subunit B/C family protein n=1 Tax=Nocardia harenae TaxID=358707 RepID=UPI000831A85D|nr:urea amidolyase family protein [Nocardia harenae]
MTEDPAFDISPAGETALLLTLAPGADPIALAEHLTVRAVPGVLELVPAAETVLVLVRSAAALERVAAALTRIAAEPGAHVSRETAGSADPLEVPVRYDGADLDAVAAQLGLTTAEVIAAHTGVLWQCAFVGFAPGFGYLRAPDGRLAVPRRDRPRTAIPAGAVALAGGYSAVYPRATPGGWQLIGSTDLALWDLRREPPALIHPGTTVRFVSTRGATRVADAERPATTVVTDPAVLVERVGPAVTVQDLGRPGWTDSGVGRSGAADPAALALANRLVGNPETAAALEVLVGGVVLRARRRITVAVTGAPLPATVDGVPVGHASVLTLAAGSVLALGVTAVGLRGYVAVRGGIEVPAVLGSRSRDTLAGLGPQPVAAGDELPIGPPPRDWPIVDQAPVPPLPEAPVPVRVRPGPRDGWFADPAALYAGEWRVTSEVDRVGVRLERSRGPALRRAITAELPTEGLPLGAIQVPPGGEPVIMLADHPVTGGYPVIGVVAAADLGTVAQLRPGTALRFHPLSAAR